MGCSTYRKKLYLNRPGELTERQRLKLERHLALCPDCRAIRWRIDETGRIAEILRETAPAPGKPLTDRIIAAVSAERRRPKSSPFRENVGAFFSVRVRVVLAAAACIVLVFFLQEALVLRRVSALERRMDAEQPAAWDPYLAVGLSGLPIAGKDASELVRLSGGWVAVRRSDLEELAESHRELKRIRVLIAKAAEPGRSGLKGESYQEIGDLVRRIAEDPRVLKWIKSAERQGGKPWNRI